MKRGASISPGSEAQHPQQMPAQWVCFFPDLTAGVNIACLGEACAQEWAHSVTAHARIGAPVRFMILAEA